MTDTNYDYDRGAIFEEVTSLAETRLCGPWTVELMGWQDGDFRIEAFSTIKATFPFEKAVRGEEQGDPFYRERIIFDTFGADEGWLRHEVVRRMCGMTREYPIWDDRIGGYTADWPAPITEDTQ